MLAAPFLEGMLFGIEPLDPVTLLAAPTLMAATATLACLLPTLRATSGEPARVLRRE